MTIKESDLYLPLKKFLASQGYEVKSEIRNCDVVAIRNEEEVVIIELKLSLNFSVILQAVDRLALSSKVYVGIPKKSAVIKRYRHRQRIFKLFKMLSLGLIAIDPKSKTGGVDVLVDPCVYKPKLLKKRKERLLKEFAERVGDPNLGGSGSRSGVMTAYRQMAIAIAGYLKENGETKASVVSKTLGIEKARQIMYRNVYGWFERPSVGMYALSPRGEKELGDWKV